VTSVHRIAQLSPKRLALLAMDLEARLTSGPARTTIAVVGIGCRLPGGVYGPDDFWTLLQEGRDAVSEVPPDRWPLDRYYDPNPDAPHRMSTRFGGFLDDIRGFDADFFGISPREAASMDPQQRLFLEVAWEALEHAGINPDQLRGTDTGVFAGVCNTDYYQRLSRARTSSQDAYVATGNAASVVSGRVAYVLNLQGPAVSIDTACSSSLVAVHQACQSLRLHETRLALAGGVNVICAPTTTMLLSKAHMMAPDGRCKTFDRRADGFVRAEGCAIVVLKRLTDAVADGDRILALIRGSATNQDGRSSGLTAPNGPSQEAVIRSALAAAGVAPHEVGYVEAHGTGTALGDPIEVRALSAVLASHRDDRRPLTIGSVKTNIGHLESAAGVAGLIKAVMVLSKRVIPAHLHLQERNPHIDWSAPLVIPRESMPWPEVFERRIAGVSSFGFSGTNAHVVLEAAPDLEDVAAEAPTGPRLLVLSARSDASLGELTRRFDAMLSHTPPEMVDDVCRTANEGRAQLPYRLAVTGTTVEQLRERLARSRANGGSSHASPSAGGTPDVVLLFPGQGTQYPGMGRDLYAAQPEFRAAFEDCARVMEPELSMPLRELMLDEAALQHTAGAQPALFAIEYACARMWMAWGVQPAAVLGHSLGEIAAACIAGVLTLGDAARLVVARGRLMQQLPAGGRMAAVFADERTVRARLGGETTLAVAAINAPAETVVSGDGAALERWCRERAGEGIESRMLRSSHAFHSPLVESILDALQEASAAMPLSPPRVPLLSNLTGRPLEPSVLDGRYWRAHAREPVRFADALSHLETARRCVFLEVGPGTTLLSLVRRASPAPGAVHLATMRAGKDERDVCLESLATLWTAGVSIDWRRVGGAGGVGRRVTLPGYPFQREPHWLDEDETRPESVTAAAAGPQWLPGKRLSTALPVFEWELSLDRLANVPVHVVAGRRMVAASFFIEAAFEAASVAGGQRVGALDQMELVAPLPADGLPRRVQTIVGTERVEIFSAAPETGDWVLHARGRLGPVAVAEQGRPESPDVVRARCRTEWTGDDLRARLAAQEIDAGLAPGRLARLWRRDGEAIARLDIDDPTARWDAALLDAVLSTLAAAVPDVSSERRVIASLGGVVVADTPAGPLWVHAVVEPAAGDLVAVLRVTDAGGHLRLRIRDIRLAPLAGAAATSARPGAYSIVWREQPLSADVGPPAAVPADDFGQLSRQHGLDRYVELKPMLDALATEYARDAFDTLGALDREGRLDPQRLDGARAQVTPQQRPLFEHLTGWLTESSGAPRGDAAAAHARLIEAFPQFSAELQLIRRCGPRLADALRGVVAPVDLLFGDPDLLPRLYQASPSARCFNALVAAQVARRCGESVGRRLRILEVGAGTGGTTAALIRHLDANTTRYVFSDVSPAFLARARREFAAYPFVEYRVFDAEQGGRGQGLDPQSFDVIVAANALHATADLRAALAHIAELLAPGGTLVLLEGTGEQRWVDITFGLTEGWWRCVGRDPSRRYPLIAADSWRDLLDGLGLQSVALLPDLAEAAATGQRVITASAPDATMSARPWIVVSGGDALAAELIGEVARKGDAGIRVASIDDPALEHLPTHAAARVVVLHPARPTRAPVPEALDACTHLATVLRRTRERWPSASVWVVTRGAQRVESDDSLQPDHASLWGLGAVAALEHADAWGGLIDLDPSSRLANEAAAVVAEVLDCQEDRVAYRRGRRFVPRLVEQSLSRRTSDVLDVSGSWLITGGLGAVGLCCAEWLADRGVRHLVLLGRTGLPAEPGPETQGSRQRVDALRARGVQVEVCPSDVSNAAEIARIMAGFGIRWPLLSGVVHAASVFDSRNIVTLGAGDFQSMFGAKAAGAWNILQHLPGSTAHVVLCSSTAAILGGVGQGAYAAANALLDALACAAGAGSVRPISVNWGLWQAMRGVSDDLRRHYAAIGFNAMAPAAALDAMHDAIARGAGQCCIAAIEWKRFRDARLARRPQPLLSEIDVAPLPSAPQQPARLSTVLERSEPRERHGIVLECVRRHIAAILQLRSAEAVPVDRGLFELGMDSLMAVELTQRLEGELGTPLASTLTFNYPTAKALAAHLLTRQGPLAGGASPRPIGAAARAVTAPLEYLDGRTH
jgi:acyl transferase domain-containing protein/acyl carrier protein/protein-L-isoaspartate O-methyltransferase